MNELLDGPGGPNILPNHEDLDITAPYGVLQSVLAEQEKEFGTRWIAYLDIDGTAYKKGMSAEGLDQRIKDGKWGLVYVTGTEVPRICMLINGGELPVPHAIADSSGTRRWYLKPEALGKDPHEITPEDFQEDLNYAATLQDKSIYDKREMVMPEFEAYQEKLKDTEFAQFDLRYPPSAQDREAWIANDPLRLDGHFTVAANTPLELLGRFIKAGHISFDEKYRVVISPGDSMPNGDKQWNFHLIHRNTGKDTMIRDMQALCKSHTGIIGGDTENDAMSLFTDYGEQSDRDLLRIVVGGSSEGFLKLVDDNDVEAKWPSPLRHVEMERMNKKHIRVFRERNPNRKGPQSLVYFMQKLELARKMHR